MDQIEKPADAKEASREIKVLQRFVEVYCREHHGTEWTGLCFDCADLLAYALECLDRCPLDPKPRCKACPVHCYTPEYRRKIREVMRFSGTYFLKRGRLDWLIRYFLT